MRIDLVTLVVPDYDDAIEFYCETLGFALAADEPALTNDGRPKRWVVVRPPGGGAGLVLARADGAAQESSIGNQTGGRVGFFLHVDDLVRVRARLEAAGVQLVGPVRHEAYGVVQVFRDPYGNKWDLVQPRA